ncbi:hypothetical protein [Phyllobacterium sp. SB3]|uniref:hypothetical protein n=1 Tax=Phyllobacterium sp. SB3 TaxID=3156073 RepID=UPI0032AFE6C6
MIYKSVAAVIFSVAMATSAFAQTSTQVDPGTTKPTGTSEGAMPDTKPADDTNKAPSQDNMGTTGGATGTENNDAMSADAPKANSSDAEKGGLNCKDQKSAGAAMSNDSTKPATKPQDCPTGN